MLFPSIKTSCIKRFALGGKDLTTFFLLSKEEDDEEEKLLPPRLESQINEDEETFFIRTRSELLDSWLLCRSPLHVTFKKVGYSWLLLAEDDEYSVAALTEDEDRKERETRECEMR